VCHCVWLWLPSFVCYQNTKTPLYLPLVCVCVCVCVCLLSYYSLCVCYWSCVCVCVYLSCFWFWFWLFRFIFTANQPTNQHCVCVCLLQTITNHFHFVQWESSIRVVSVTLAQETTLVKATHLVKESAQQTTLWLETGKNKWVTSLDCKSVERVMQPVTRGCVETVCQIRTELSLILTAHDEGEVIMLWERLRSRELKWQQVNKANQTVEVDLVIDLVFIHDGDCCWVSERWHKSVRKEDDDSQKDKRKE